MIFLSFNLNPVIDVRPADGVACSFALAPSHAFVS